MTNIDQTKLAKLLSATGTIVKEHLQNVRDKGEDFNIFSVLKMEEDETKTHSGMIVALLDPKGNHYQNEMFLELFLNAIGYDFEGENLKLTQVKAEHNLGPIPQDYSEGGFIDILISFPSGKAIAIENKIKAGDQPKQMYRYSLYKSGACTLYYLTMVAKHPEQFSLHTLTDKDYDVLLYDNHILKWLEQCIQVVKPGSIIENALKQYLILIKKITNTMDKHLEDNLKSLILNNLEEAKYISSHYQKAVESIKERFRSALCDKIKSMDLEVTPRLGNNTSHIYSQIWLSSEKLHNNGEQFGLESFSGSGHNNGRLFIGIFDRKKEHRVLHEGDYRLNSSWPLVRDLKTPSNNHLNLSSIKTLEKLIDDADYFNEMVDEVANQVKGFVELYH